MLFTNSTFSISTSEHVSMLLTMGGQNHQNYMPILRGCTHFDGVVFINKGSLIGPILKGGGGGGTNLWVARLTSHN